MTDTFNVTFAWSQTTAYTPGSTMTGTISGNDVLTTTTTTNQTVGPLTLTLTAADGSTQTITTTSATAQVTSTSTTPESVTITKVVDNSASPLTWTIAANGLSISAVAP
jgi:hypothetical protein